MVRNLAKFPKLSSSFLSCEKDTETILRKLFVESQPHSDMLKRLLVINTPDCMDNLCDEKYNEKIKKASVFWLKDNGYIQLTPRVQIKEHELLKTYLCIAFDNFVRNSYNPEYRDCTVAFDIICNNECWDLGNLRQRPFKIAGYIDSILNGTKLSGIGTLQFMGAGSLLLNEDFSGYTLLYQAVHMTDDRLESNE